MPLQMFDDYLAVGDENLRVAINLFVDDTSYIAALQLAVAAETLFDRAIDKDGGHGVPRWEFDARQYVDPSAPPMRYTAFVSEEHRERHAAAHGPENRRKVLPMRTAKDAACTAIVRAQTNAIVLGRRRTAADEKFQDWMMEEVAPLPEIIRRVP